MGIGSKKILVVDDDPAICRLIAKILDAQGAKCTCIHTVTEGLETAQSTVPDIIILDLNFPELTGYDFLVARKQDNVLSRIPVIVLSANSDKTSVRKAIALGATNYLAKPINAKIILQKIKKVFLENDSDEMLEYTFDKPITIDAITNCKITKISEKEMMFESNIKFNHKVNSLRVKGKLVEALGFPFDVFKPIGESHVSNEGTFLTVLNIVGLSELVAKTLRNKIRLWK